MAFGSESDESDSRLGQLPLLGNTSVVKSLPDTSVPSKPKIEKKHCCKVPGCNAKFSRPWKLAAHTSVHSGMKPFECDVKGCDKKYTSSSHLRRHKAISHSDKKKPVSTYKCTYLGCEQELKTLETLKKHERRIHMGKPFPCPHCDKWFLKHFQLKDHVSIHTGVYPFQCKQCSLSYAHRRDLRRHERGHRVHICPITTCIATFNSWSLVRKHVASEHPTAYTCDECGKAFKKKAYLRRHMRVHIGDSDSTCSEVIKPRKYRCHHCQGSFRFKWILRRHIAVQHMGGKSQQKEKKTTVRAIRKDAGLSKKSMASVLSNIALPSHIEKELLMRDEVNTCDQDIGISKFVLDRINEEGVQKVLTLNTETKGSTKENVMSNHEIDVEKQKSYSVTADSDTQSSQDNLSELRFENIEATTFENSEKENNTAQRNTDECRINDEVIRKQLLLQLTSKKPNYLQLLFRD